MNHTNSMFLRSGKLIATTAIAASLIATCFQISRLLSFLSSIPLSSICAACNKSSVVIYTQIKQHMYIYVDVLYLLEKQNNSN